MAKNLYSTETKNFAGIIEEDEDGIRRLRLLSPDYYVTQLKDFKLGEQVSLFISSKKPKRSDSQNRLYWVYLSAIEKETGNDKDDMHNLFKGMFLSNGIKEIFGHKVRSSLSSTKLSKSEFTEYLMKIENLTGILIPNTAEWYDLKN